MDKDILGLLGKLPLAEATYLLWNEVLPEQTLNAFYDSHRGRCYEKVFTFSNLVYLVNDALCKHEGRARPTLNEHESSEQCPASETAFYSKLRHMPIALSEAFLAHGSSLLRPYLPTQPYVELPASLREFRTLVFDGKSFKHAAKRLKPARKHPGRGLGGKALVALELATGLIVGMAADPDGHVNEAKLVPEFLPKLREQLSPGQNLWLADQLFGDLAQVIRCTEHGDHCVLRLHSKSQFTPDLQQPARQGADKDGRPWMDEIGQLHSRRCGTKTMRRITLQRPDKDPLILITDLLDADAYPANDLLELYRQRWGIEHVFQTVSEVFQLKHLIGSHPKAIIFQASLCMMLYNLLQVLRGILAETQQRPTASISTHNLMKDLHKELITLHYLVEPDQALEALRDRAASVTDLRTYLYERLGQAWKKRWIKSPAKKRHTPRKKHKRGTGGHFSIHRVLLEHEKAKHV